MMKRLSVALLGLSLVAMSCNRPTATAADKPAASKPASQEAPVARIEKTEAEWKQILDPEQYQVIREKGTERSGSGEYVNNHERGTYKCAACGLELFSSDSKFESGTGWPSFWQPIARNHVTEITDRSHGMTRTEVTCARCGGHLGHVFDDGPKPTGLRYCMNSISLKFTPAEAKDKK
jgi:peptide-methionine (R)-S-oxide reductase